VSLAARHLEANGIATVPRFVFSDIPLGNPTARTWLERKDKHRVLREPGTI